jgi:hypothetical protein
MGFTASRQYTKVVTEITWLNWNRGESDEESVSANINIIRPIFS